MSELTCGCEQVVCPIPGVLAAWFVSDCATHWVTGRNSGVSYNDETQGVRSRTSVLRRLETILVRLRAEYAARVRLRKYCINSCGRKATHVGIEGITTDGREIGEWLCRKCWLRGKRARG